jgi:heme-degrading monooxygenase HmoA
MIARVWHGRVRKDRASAYEAYLEKTGLPDYRATPGNRGVFLLRRDEGEITHFTTLSLWESIDAIRAFAGADYERARYYPEDDAFLLEREPHVLHHRVVAAPDPSRPVEPSAAA